MFRAMLSALATFIVVAIPHCVLGADCSMVEGRWMDGAHARICVEGEGQQTDLVIYLGETHFEVTDSLTGYPGSGRITAALPIVWPTGGAQDLLGIMVQLAAADGDCVTERGEVLLLFDLSEGVPENVGILTSEYDIDPDCEGPQTLTRCAPHPIAAESGVWGIRCSGPAGPSACVWDGVRYNCTVQPEYEPPIPMCRNKQLQKESKGSIACEDGPTVTLKDDRIRQVTQWAGKKKSGFMAKFHADGRPELVGAFDLNGKPSGPWLVWRDDGELRKIEHYEAGEARFLRRIDEGGEVTEEEGDEPSWWREGAQELASPGHETWTEALNFSSACEDVVFSAGSDIWLVDTCGLNAARIKDVDGRIVAFDLGKYQLSWAVAEPTGVRITSLDAKGGFWQWPEIELQKNKEPYMRESVREVPGEFIRDDESGLSFSLETYLDESNWNEEDHEDVYPVWLDRYGWQRVKQRKTGGPVSVSLRLGSLPRPEAELYCPVDQSLVREVESVSGDELYYTFESGEQQLVSSDTYEDSDGEDVRQHCDNKSILAYSRSDGTSAYSARLAGWTEDGVSLGSLYWEGARDEDEGHGTSTRWVHAWSNNGDAGRAQSKPMYRYLLSDFRGPDLQLKSVSPVIILD